MNIKFPLQQFKAHKSAEPSRFSVYSPILVSLHKYLLTDLLSQLFEFEFAKTAVYEYYLTSFEISYLGQINEEDAEMFFTDMYVAIPYNFVFGNLKRRVKGIFDINITFIDKNSLEESYYRISIKRSEELEQKIDVGSYSFQFIMQFCSEYLEKTWDMVFKYLKQQDAKRFSLSVHSKSDCLLIISQINTEKILRAQLSEFISKGIDFCESIVDTYYILSNLYYRDVNSENEIFVSINDLLDCRSLKKNPNSNGIRSGYKITQKAKVIKNLFILDSLDIISLIEIRKDFYRVTFNGECLDEQLFILPKKIIEYNFKTQIYEKRLGAYLFFSLCAEKTKGIKVPLHKIISITKDLATSLKPSQIRDRIESALDQLCSDLIIRSWHYDFINEYDLSGKNWIDVYKKYYIVVS